MRALVSFVPQESAAEMVREQAAVAREQAAMARDQAQMIRDAARASRDAARMQQGIVIHTPIPMSHLSRRQEGMLFAGSMMAIMAVTVVLYPLMRALGRRLEGAPRRDDLAANGSAERLARIEQAVDAMAVEIERISEGQRFTTRLLTSRSPAELPLER